MFGIKDFSAIINPPQTAILAVGTGRELLGNNQLNNLIHFYIVQRYSCRYYEKKFQIFF